MAKKEKKEAVTLTAYCMKTKEKNVPMLNAKIVLKNNKYIAVGEDAAGNKLSTIVSKEKAIAVVEAKLAKKEGW